MDCGTHVGCEVGLVVVVVPSVVVDGGEGGEVFPVEVFVFEGGLVPLELVSLGACLPVGPAGEEVVVGAVDAASDYNTNRR